MQLELLHTIEMPNYPRKVLTSKERRAKYFIFPKDEAVRQKKKYSSTRYTWKEYISASKKKETRLYDTSTNEFVIKNSRTAGKEKWLVINGQKYYNGVYRDYEKGKILNELNRFYSSFLEALNPITQYPLHIEYIFDVYLDEDTDLDNHGFPYYKGFQDCLTKCGVIFNDSNRFIKSFKVEHNQLLHPESENTLIVKIYAISN